MSSKLWSAVLPLPVLSLRASVYWLRRRGSGCWCGNNVMRRDGRRRPPAPMARQAKVPPEVITTALRGRPHLALALVARSSPRKVAKAFICRAEAPGENVGTCSAPCSMCISWSNCHIQGSGAACAFSSGSTRFAFHTVPAPTSPTVKQQQNCFCPNTG